MRKKSRETRTAIAKLVSLSGLELHGKGALLRPVRLADAGALYQHIRDRQIARYTAIPHPYPETGMREFLTRAIKEMRTGKRYIFAIRRYESDEPVGVIDLFSHYPKWQRMELGYWLGRTFWNQGIMTESVKLVLAFAFDVLKLHRVDIGHFVPNEASRRVIEKCWFRREGVTREGACQGRRWHNLVNYGLLATEYRKIRSGSAQSGPDSRAKERRAR